MRRFPGLLQFGRTAGVFSSVLVLLAGCVSGGSDGNILTDEDPRNIMLAVVAPFGQTVEVDLRLSDVEQTLPGCPGLAETTTCHTILTCPRQIEALRARRLDDLGAVLEVVDLSGVAGATLLRDVDYSCEQVVEFDLSGSTPVVRVRPVDGAVR